MVAVDIAPDLQQAAKVEVLGLEANAAPEVDRLRLRLRYIDERVLAVAEGGGVVEQQLDVDAVVLPVDIDRGELGGELRKRAAIGAEFDRGHTREAEAGLGRAGRRRHLEHLGLVGVELGVRAGDGKRLGAFDGGDEEPRRVLCLEAVHRGPEPRDARIDEKHHHHEEPDAEPDRGHEDLAVRHARRRHGEDLVVGGKPGVDDRAGERPREGQRELEHRHRGERHELQQVLRAKEVLHDRTDRRPERDDRHEDARGQEHDAEKVRDDVPKENARHQDAAWSRFSVDPASALQAAEPAWSAQPFEPSQLAQAKMFSAAPSQPAHPFPSTPKGLPERPSAREDPPAIV